MLRTKGINRKREKRTSVASATTESGADHKQPPGAETHTDISHLDAINLDFEGEIIDDGVGAFLSGSGIAALDTDHTAVQPAQQQPNHAKPRKQNAKKKGSSDTHKKEIKKKPTREQILAQAKAKAKQEFEEEKASVLATVPASIQDMFGQVGFAKWAKTYLPAIILSPYKVPPGEVRDLWMQMFNKMQENGRPLEKMSYLVFWYGEENASDYYSLIPSSNFVPYEKATQKQLDYAKSANKKREQGKPLSKDDQQRLRGWAQLLEDLEKEPDQRIRGDVVFEEIHECLSMGDLEELSGDEISEEDHESDPKVVAVELGGAASVDSENGLGDNDADAVGPKEDSDSVESDRKGSSSKLKARRSAPDKKANLGGTKRKRKRRESSAAALESQEEPAEEPIEAKPTKRGEKKTKQEKYEEPHQPTPKKSGLGRLKRDSISSATSLKTDPDRPEILLLTEEEFLPHAADPTEDARKQEDEVRPKKKRKKVKARQLTGDGVDVASKPDAVETVAGDEPLSREMPRKASAEEIPGEPPRPRKRSKKRRGMNQEEQGATADGPEVPNHVPISSKEGKQRGGINQEEQGATADGPEVRKRGGINQEEQGATADGPEVPDDASIPRKKGKKRRGIKQGEQGAIADDPEVPDEASIPRKEGKKRRGIKQGEQGATADGPEVPDEASIPRKEGKKRRGINQEEQGPTADDPEVPGDASIPRKGVNNRGGVKQVEQGATADDPEVPDDASSPRKEGKKRRGIKQEEQGATADDPEVPDDASIPRKEGKKRRGIKQEEQGATADGPDLSDEASIPRKGVNNRGGVNQEEQGAGVDVLAREASAEDLTPKRSKKRRAKKQKEQKESANFTADEETDADSIQTSNKKRRARIQEVEKTHDDELSVGALLSKPKSTMLSGTDQIDHTTEPVGNSDDGNRRKMKEKKAILDDGEGEESLDAAEDAGTSSQPKMKVKKPKQLVAEDEAVFLGDTDEETKPDHSRGLERAKFLFSKNENDFESFLREWLTAIEHKDSKKLNGCVAKMQTRLCELGSHFIETYCIADYFKETKIVFKHLNNTSGLDQLAELRKSMKKHYNDVKSKKILSFKPEVKYPDLASPSTAKKDGRDARAGHTLSQDSSLFNSQNSHNGSPDHNSAIVSELSHDNHHHHQQATSSDFKNRARAAESLDWTRCPVEVETSDLQRLTGIEFLRQMGFHFPEGTVNVDSVAISIEKALYNFTGAVNRIYWERLHGVVAAVCGDSKPGSLMRSIESGQIKNPSELIITSNDKLVASFQGE